jgi:predicted metal-binding membrane protein
MIPRMVGILLRCDRGVVLLGLAVVVALAWTYLLLGAGTDMETMDMGGGQTMPMPPIWTPSYVGLVFLMWAIMMVAMMLPSAAPTILLVAALSPQRSGSAPASAVFFGMGYLLVWFGFSLGATALEWGLNEASLLSETMALGSMLVAGSILVGAGIYQWTPLKDTCLRHCRSPVSFLVQNWREGALGAIWTGVRHGSFCLGCCWMLMALLFVGGVMNLVWIGAIALLVLIEKVVPWGGRMSRIAGIVLAGWGVATLIMAI